MINSIEILKNKLTVLYPDDIKTVPVVYVNMSGIDCRKFFENAGNCALLRSLSPQST